MNLVVFHWYGEEQEKSHAEYQQHYNAVNTFRKELLDKGVMFNEYIVNTNDGPSGVVFLKVS